MAPGAGFESPAHRVLSFGRTGPIRDTESVRARITWSVAHQRLGLFAGHETVDPAWLLAGDAHGAESWSLRCRSADSPREQGSPSVAEVSLYLPSAPVEWLRTGTRLALFERLTGEFASVEILGP